MKKILIFTVLAVLITLNAFAESPKTQTASVETIQKRENLIFQNLNKTKHTRIDWIDRLNMTDNQAVYTLKLYKASDAKIIDLAKQIQELHKQIDQIIEQDDEKIYAVANKKQQARMKRIKEQIHRLKREEEPKKPRAVKKIRPVQ